ncbi:MAG TPA: TonB-dependent receptor [Candidatus Polarisedimenticolia bacterium]|nr:TonB-dependent receptor [Candidatus Polarisedimenticolia bacterium]
MRFRLAAASFLAAALIGPLVTPVRAQSGPTLFGAIRGTVSDADFDTSIAGARITIVEAFLTTVTDASGRFVFERVPPGTYTLSITRDGYQRQVVNDVVVAPGSLAEVRASLSLEVQEMEEMVVTGEDLLGGTEVALLDIRSEATALQDAISSEIMRKTGASDVAGALKFVVGASVAGGKYATVRGLSDRYTGTTLNGVRVPSADPRRRAAQIDLFPTGTIENVTVTKTFTPDLEGDFTGGGVDIQTRSVPPEATLNASFGVEYNTQATGNPDFLTYGSGGVSFLGIAGKERDLPEEARQPLPALPAPTVNALTPQQIADGQAWDRFIRSFDPTMGVSRAEPGPNTSFAISGGKRYDQGEGSAVGVMAALSYQHKYDFYEDGQNNTFEVQADQPFVLGQPRSDSAGLDQVLVGLLGSFEYQASADDKIGFRLVANQAAEDEARFQESGSDLTLQNQALHYTERTVASGQLYGKESWGGTEEKKGPTLDWYAAYNVTRQDEPDVRFFRNQFDSNTQVFFKPANSTDADNSRRIWRNIGEGGWQAAANYTLPFTQWTGSEGKFKAGLFYDATDREYNEDSFVYHFMNQLGPTRNPAIALNSSYLTYKAQGPDDLWTNVLLDPERIGLAGNRCEPPDVRIGNIATAGCAAHNQLLWYLDSQSGTDVDYTGDQSVEAGYAMGELPINSKFKVVAGARYEKTTMNVFPDNAANRIEVIKEDANGNHGIFLVTNEEAEAHIEDASVLPSAGVIYEIIPRMNLRGSWSRTLARPTFREIAPVATEEFLAGDEFVGNTELTLSSITNYDLRWEWFRGEGEVLAASVFYKTLTDPIEYISFVAAGRSFVQPVNYEEGRLRGAEVEARQPLGRFGKPLEGWAVGVNYTVLDSEVDVPLKEQQSLAGFGLNEETRRLQGQPESLFNANVTYDLERLGISTGLFYNVVGETLATGAAVGENGGVPNSFEKTYRTLDFTYAQRLVNGKTDLSFSLKAKNLLQPERESVYRGTDGQEVIKRQRETAILYGLSFNLKW